MVARNGNLGLTWSLIFGRSDKVEIPKDGLFNGISANDMRGSPHFFEAK